MNLSEEMEMKGYAFSLQIQLVESLDTLQGERKVNALRLLKLLGWYEKSIDELQSTLNRQNQEIRNLKELLG